MADVDFDLDAARAARAEMLGEPKTFRFGGEVFDLPAECPYLFAESLNADDARTALATLLGDDGEERFFTHSPSIIDLTVLVLEIAKLYGLGDEGNSVASGGSSPNGSRRPKRISKGSTA